MIQNLQESAKQFQEGSLYWHKSNLGNNKISTKQLNFTCKETRERGTNKTPSQQKKINHKDQSRNKMKQKKLIEKNN